MRCIVLQDLNGAHLGFLLFSIDLSESDGDCVFMAMPLTELYDTAAAELLFQRREAGESTWQVFDREPLSVVVRTSGVPAELFIRLGGSDGGHWSVGNEADQQVVGRALLAPSPTTQ